MDKYAGCTPGPWEVDDANLELVAKKVEGIYEYIADCNPDNWSETSMSQEEMRANARLIKDSPMLAGRVKELEKTVADISRSMLGASNNMDKLAEQNRKMLAIIKECKGLCAIGPSTLSKNRIASEIKRLITEIENS